MGHLICSTHRRRALVIGGKVIHRSGHEVGEKYCAPQVIIAGQKIDLTRSRLPKADDNLSARNLLQQIFGKGF